MARGPSEARRAAEAPVRRPGELVTWNDERGFGFIRPDGETREVFVHISAFAPNAERPVQGQRLTFETATAPDGRTKAVDARPPGLGVGRPGGTRIPVRLGTLSYLAIAAFLPLYIVLSVRYHLPWYIHAIYLATTVGAFVAYALDKSAAVHGGWRLAERSLLLLGLVGGWPGAIVAQQLFRHKTRKRSFVVQFWVTVVANVVLFIVFTQVHRLLGAD